ncbi:transketolase [Isoptericola sp. b441]|uniref:Transketolase n=1 Tax=Actinotalea lenta TaxID=3064654 RepID=A0ABT9DAV7_9CELL|nr:transketolase [Isoptericola sp. b441]MDO8107695.1 transketolase [Isoptericola sp. b441]
MTTSLEWTELDSRAVDTARILAADAVERAGSGHPGTAISLAPLAYLLYQKVMTGDPSDPGWRGRDRFVLSAGHASLVQYAQLFLAGYGLEVEDLAATRTEGGRTPAHPEYGHTAGVECTTGPLGAGVANAVGFAMAARRDRALLDPDAADGTSVFDRTVYCVAGDGCMQEGVAAEASSLAGTQKLGNLILIYDDNRITIEGGTQISFTEDVMARYAAYGWDVHHVDWTHGGQGYAEDLEALYAALRAAKQVTDRPSFIRLTTVIGWSLPTKAGHHSIHGARLGAEELAGLKVALGFDPTRSFQVDPEVLAHTRRNAADRAAAARQVWDARFDSWRQEHPDKAVLLDRLTSGGLPDELPAALPSFPVGMMSTRAASGAVLTAIADAVPELWGGSADLAGSNHTSMRGQSSFLPPERSNEEFTGDYNGRTLHFGIREHAMGNILNGIAMSGTTRPYGGTYLVFSDYMRAAVRLAALQKAPSIFVWTHDSIAVGEDGPTHQPVEQIAALRAIPGLDVIRPMDANETAHAWAQALANDDRPSAIILSRQDLPTVDRGPGACAPAEHMARGGYTLLEASTGSPQVVLIGTGSEVDIALSARDRLEEDGVPTRVVSMPCLEWFDNQPQEYRAEVLPQGTLRVAIEAGVRMGWREYVGDGGAIVSVDRFGESAPGPRLYEKYGITPDAVVDTVRTALGEVTYDVRPSRA